MNLDHCKKCREEGTGSTVPWKPGLSGYKSDINPNKAGLFEDSYFSGGQFEPLFSHFKKK